MKPTSIISALITFFVGVTLLSSFAVNLHAEPSDPGSAASSIKLGIERPELYLPLLKQRSIGLVVNQTSRVDGAHLLDVLVAQGIDVKYVFAPEHGLRGDHGAGETVKNGVDVKTGIEIVSIYGKHKKPEKRYLDAIDALVFDIQDVGVRYYTYISSLHYMMQACAEQSTPLIVLDRPNPNGDYVDGPVLEPAFSSFVGMHPIPLVHGLTIGELAQMINREGWLETDSDCELIVIPMTHYRHDMKYSLPVKPSPNLPNDLAIKLYPSLGFFEATPVSIGRGTTFPFQVIGYNDNSMGAFRFIPRSIAGAAENPKFKGEEVYGTDLRSSVVNGLNLRFLLDWKTLFDQKGLDFISSPGFFDRLAGTDKLRKQIESGASEQEIRQSWKAGLERYAILRKKYLLYP